MIHPSEPDYQQTKLLKRTGASLESPFKELADWVSATYGVRVLNIIYETIIPDNRPRLSIILDTEKDRLTFRSGRFGYNEIDQQRVKEKFEAILSEQADLRFNIKNLLVIFSAFEPVAIIEANESLTEEEMHHLKLKLANDDLWEIHRSRGSVTFLFYTDAQVRRYEAAGLKDIYAQEYLRLLQTHDEFGYLQNRDLTVRFDSKQNFDQNYQGNWFYYSRDH